MSLHKIILPLLLLFLMDPAISAEQTKEIKNVLVLFSLSPSTPAYRIMSDGIRARLTQAFGDNYNLHMEYLQTERFPRDQYPQEQFDPINGKYQDIELDLMILIGIDIMPAFRSCADDHLQNIPAISFDFDLSVADYHHDISVNSQTAEFYLRINAKKIIETALSIFPGADTIYFFCGISRIDRFFYMISREAVKDFTTDKQMIFITDISMDEVIKKVRSIPVNSIIVVPNFNVDSKQVPYYNPEAIRLISQNATAPVFTYSDMGFGDGPLGGYVISFSRIANLLGSTAVEILNGADPNSFRFPESEYYEYLFDWRELLRRDLAGSKLIPEGSIIKYKEISFFDRYKLFIIGGALFLVLQSLLIINLIRLNRKQKLITRQLIESENRFRELVREDRILSLGLMNASITHELNQPLTAILSTAQAGIRFIDSDKADPAMIKQIFQNVVEDDKRAASILSSIRSMMKLEKREKEKVDLNKLIKEIINIYQGEATVKQIQLNVKLTEQPVNIFADQIQIQQVLLNFITNASQAIEGSKTVNKTIVITETVDNDFVTVSVRDYGEGIDESLKDKIFSPFITSKKEGSGIGLAISQSIIQDHHGKVRAENMPGGGASFSFILKVY